MRKLLFLGLLVVLSASTAKAAESLYNRSAARPLEPAKYSLFGPQASKFKYDSRMVRAAEIAQSRAHRHSTSLCWRYVKDALLAAKIITTRPDTAYAKQAAGELQNEYGFKKLAVKDPYHAPVGSVIVYGGRGAGHVELRTTKGFVSDFVSLRPSNRPLIGVYVKPRA